MHGFGIAQSVWRLLRVRFPVSQDLSLPYSVQTGVLSSGTGGFMIVTCVCVMMIHRLGSLHNYFVLVKTEDRTFECRIRFM
jgi:hypothetical protein